MNLDNAYIIDTKTSMNTLKKQEGFTLIEVLIAVSIFAVGLLAVAAMQTSAIRVNSTAGRITELSTCGIDKLEELLSLPFTDAQLSSAGNPHADPVTPDGYTVTWNTFANNPVPGTMRIDMTVAGKGKTLRITSIRSQSL
jgi:type IV pilus assembly protein PilV